MPLRSKSLTWSRLALVVAPSVLVSSLYHSHQSKSLVLDYGPIKNSGVELGLLLFVALILRSHREVLGVRFSFRGVLAVSTSLGLALGSSSLPAEWSWLKWSLFALAFLTAFLVWLPKKDCYQIVSIQWRGILASAALLCTFVVMDSGYSVRLWQWSNLSHWTASAAATIASCFGIVSVVYTGVSGEVVVGSSAYTNVVSFLCAGFEGVYLFLGTFVAVCILDGRRIRHANWIAFLVVGVFSMLFLNAVRIGLIVTVAELAVGNSGETGRTIADIFHSGIGTFVYVSGILLALAAFYQLSYKALRFRLVLSRTVIAIALLLVSDTAVGGCTPAPCCAGTGSMNVPGDGSCFSDLGCATPCSGSPELPKGLAGKLAFVLLIVGTTAVRRRFSPPGIAKPAISP